MPRAQHPSSSSSKQRHDPLHVQLGDDAEYQKYGRVSNPGKRSKPRRSDAEDDGVEDTVLDPKTSRKILELAKVQQDELEEPRGSDEDSPLEDDDDEPSARMQAPSMALDDDDEEEEIIEEYEEIDEEELQINAEDMETMEAMLPPNSGERRTLADLIFAKMDSAESPQASSNPAVIQKVQQDPKNIDPALGIDPRVVAAYEKVGQVLHTYKSGKLPKIFKVIPALPQWARMLALTHPERWSPHAARAATKLFISSMKPPQAQLFLSVVLLDAIREDIQENKKLNVQYYEALKRALYKPGAFFKGIIFPILDQGCTLREAAILSSVLSRTKIPVLHASAALLRIAEMEHYTGPNSLFLRILIDKKFSLPYKVVDALVFHFIRLSNTYKARNRGESEKLPVLWHQSLLVFAQRYASDLTPEQKDALLDVVRATPHAQIGPEVRRELVNSVVRGAPREEAMDVEMN